MKNSESSYLSADIGFCPIFAMYFYLLYTEQVCL